MQGAQQTGERGEHVVHLLVHGRWAAGFVVELVAKGQRLGLLRRGARDKAILREVDGFTLRHADLHQQKDKGQQQHFLLKLV